MRTLLLTLCFPTLALAQTQSDADGQKSAAIAAGGVATVSQIAATSSIQHDDTAWADLKFDIQADTQITQAQRDELVAVCKIGIEGYAELTQLNLRVQSSIDNGDKNITDGNLQYAAAKYDRAYFFYSGGLGAYQSAADAAEGMRYADAVMFNDQLYDDTYNNWQFYRNLP